MDAGLAAAATPIAEELARTLAQDVLAGPPAVPASGPPVTEVGPMIDGREGEQALHSDPEEPRDPISARRFAFHAEIETQAGASREEARENALAAMGEHDAASAAIILPAPPAMDADVFASHIRRLTGALDAVARVTVAAKLIAAA